MKNKSIVLLKNVNKTVLDNWNKQFVKPKNTSLESVWRRTQEPYNSDKSGWKNENDKRRRMLQFKYDIGIQNYKKQNNLICKNFYIWLHLTLPMQELESYLERNKNILKKNKYKELKPNIFIKDNYQIVFKKNVFHKVDVDNANKNMYQKLNYETLEVIISNYNTKESQFDKIWGVLEVGYRNILKSGTPQIVPLSVELIEKYLPAEVEIGSGASYEIGIPPLHNLHHYFYISDKNKKSYFGGNDDNLIKDFSDNEEKFLKKTAEIITSSIKIKEGIFHKNLTEMYKKKFFIGNINVNSFDALHLRSGVIKEKFLRDWNKDKLRPIFSKQKKSKALFVIGLHADRRQTQQYAREQGLKIIHVDSEGFSRDNFITKYSKESMQDSDILIRAKASEFGKVLQKILSKHKK